MHLDTRQEIERAINALPPQELVKLYAWLDQHRLSGKSEATVFEQGLSLFGSPDDAALLDEVVQVSGKRQAAGHGFKVPR